MTSDELNAALAVVERTEFLFDRAMERIGFILRGNLRHAGVENCRALKHQLRDFDSRTGRWVS